MKSPLAFLCASIFLLACQPASPDAPPPPPRAVWSLAIHGGAGQFGEEDLSVAQQQAYAASLDAALSWGQEQLDRGASAVDVVEGVVRLMEDDSLFNAGRGAVFTSEGTH